MSLTKPQLHNAIQEIIVWAWDYGDRHIKGKIDSIKCHSILEEYGTPAGVARYRGEQFWEDACTRSQGRQIIPITEIPEHWRIAELYGKYSQTRKGFRKKQIGKKEFDAQQLTMEFGYYLSQPEWAPIINEHYTNQQAVTELIARIVAAVLDPNNPPDKKYYSFMQKDYKAKHVTERQKVLRAIATIGEKHIGSSLLPAVAPVGAAAVDVGAAVVDVDAGPLNVLLAAAIAVEPTVHQVEADEEEEEQEEDDGYDGENEIANLYPNQIVDEQQQEGEEEMVDDDDEDNDFASTVTNACHLYTEDDEEDNEEEDENYEGSDDDEEYEEDDE
jgi:hypothetical protein